MCDLGPLDFKELSELDKLSRDQLMELEFSCSCLLEAEYKNHTDEECDHAAKIQRYARNLLGGKYKIRAQHEDAFFSIKVLLHGETEITQEHFAKAVEETIEALKTGYAEIIEEYELADNIPGFELEWCVLKSFPNVVEKDSAQFKHWEATIGREVTDAEFNRARDLSLEIIEAYNAYIVLEAEED